MREGTREEEKERESFHINEKYAHELGTITDVGWFWFDEINLVPGL